MKKLVYSIAVAWVILASCSKFLGASWWVALSWIWLPLGVALVIAIGLTLSVDLGKWLSERGAEPDACENCLFGITAQFDKEGKCLGETLSEVNGESIKRPALCKYYKRQGR